MDIPEASFMILHVFFLNLCGKLASRFSHCLCNVKKFPLEKPKQGASENLRISVVIFKRRLQKILSLGIELCDIVMRLCYFLIMQSLQCWEWQRLLLKNDCLLACLHLHCRHVIPCSRAASHDEQNLCMCIGIIHLNLNWSSYECERRLKPLCLHNFSVLVYTESKLKRKMRGEGRKGKKRERKRKRKKKGVQSAHNHVIYRQGRILVVIWTVDLQHRKSPYWTQWSQVRCCLGLCERDETAELQDLRGAVLALHKATVPGKETVK